MRNHESDLEQPLWTTDSNKDDQHILIYTEKCQLSLVNRVFMTILVIGAKRLLPDKSSL